MSREYFDTLSVLERDSFLAEGGELSDKPGPRADLSAYHRAFTPHQAIPKAAWDTLPPKARRFLLAMGYRFLECVSGAVPESHFKALSSDNQILFVMAGCYVLPERHG